MLIPLWLLIPMALLALVGFIVVLVILGKVLGPNPAKIEALRKTDPVAYERFRQQAMGVMTIPAGALRVGQKLRLRWDSKSGILRGHVERKRVV